MFPARQILLSAALAWNAASASTGPVKSLEFQAPRPFGYVIGDEIRQRLVLDVEKPYRLQSERLPAPRRLNHWLELREVAVGAEDAGRFTRYHIALRYQTFYAPLEVKMLAVPGFTLSVAAGGEPLNVPVPAWSFTMSPIRELAVRKADGHEYMRPDDPPAPLDAGAHRLRLALFALVFLAGSAAFLYRFGLLPFLARGQSFNRACRDLAGMAERPLDEEIYRAALKAVHRAFDTVYGEPVFPGRLECFFDERPQFACERGEIEVFFEVSRRIFFAERSGGAETFPLARMLVLCRRLRAIERGLR